MDTTYHFLPAAQAFLDGLSPYSVSGFFNPPWLLLLFVPFVGSEWAVAAIRTLNLVAFVVLARRVGRWRAVLPFLLSPPVISSLWYGNIDGIVLLGLYWGGMWLLSIKPQLTSGVMVYDVLHGSLPTGPVLGYVASMFVYGLWPLQVMQQTFYLHNASWDYSLWPWGLVLGIPLLWWAVRTHRRGVALACSPLLSPYISSGGWCTVTLLVASKMPWLLLIVDIALITWYAMEAL